MRKKHPNPIMLTHILDHFNWKTGNIMVFPFVEAGRERKATVLLKDLYRIIKWE